MAYAYISVGIIKVLKFRIIVATRMRETISALNQVNSETYSSDILLKHM